MDFEKIKETNVNELKDYIRLTESNEPTDIEKVNIIKKTLQMLPEMQRDILTEFYAYRTKRFSGHIARLQVKYNLDKFRLYQERTKAILCYCICKLALALSINN